MPPPNFSRGDKCPRSKHIGGKTEMKFVIITQANLETINIMNQIKRDQMYCVLNEGNGFSTIAQYSSQYDSFKIVTCKSDDLNPHNRLVNGDTEV